MTTLGELIDSIHSSLHSYTGLQEQASWLTAPVDGDDLTMSVAGSEEILRGVAEVESELLYVHTSSGDTITLAPFGRGYRGTTAAAHAANTPIYFDPAFPRAEISRAVTQAIEALHPTLYRVVRETIPTEANTVGYELPAGADRVLRVEIQVAGDPTVNNWVDYTSWDFAPDSPIGTGKVLNFYNGLPVGSSISVTYATKFTGTGLETDELAVAFGLPEAYVDLITYAVSSRMVRFLDPARLQLGAVENISRASVVQAGDAGRLANQLYAVYQTRLQEERRRLLELHPAQLNFLPR